MQNAEQKINEFVAITLLSAMSYKSFDDIIDFMDIDEDYKFGIVTEDFEYVENLYPEELTELFNNWHIKANGVFLVRRNELIKELEK